VSGCSPNPRALYVSGVLSLHHFSNIAFLLFLACALTQGTVGLGLLVTRPWAACLASSACSFPATLWWPGHHSKVGFFLFSRILLTSKASCYELGAARCLQLSIAARLSENTLVLVEVPITACFTALCIAVTSTSKTSACSRASESFLTVPPLGTFWTHAHPSRSQLL